jgi:hypothetical protein
MIRINLLKNSIEKHSADTRHIGKIFIVFGILIAAGICNARGSKTNCSKRTFAFYVFQCQRGGGSR